MFIIDKANRPHRDFARGRGPEVGESGPQTFDLGRECGGMGVSEAKRLVGELQSSRNPTVGLS
jgi:hypothetical protein